MSALSTQKWETKRNYKIQTKCADSPQNGSCYFPLSPSIVDCMNAITTERGALRKASDIFLKGEHKQPTGFTFVFIDQEE